MCESLFKRFVVGGCWRHFLVSVGGLLDRSLMLRSLCVSVCQGDMLKQNIEAGVPRNQNIPPELHQVFSNYQLHNVSREDDPTTQQFKTFVEVAAATSYRFPGHADKFGRCVIINLLLGRCIFGTSAMALLIGFLHGWSACEKSIVAAAVELIVRKGVVDIFITRAYSAPRILRNALMANALGNLDAVLRPSPSIKNIRPQFWRSATIPGKLEQVSACWDVAPDITEVFDAKNRQRICSAFSLLPYFGTSLPDGSREAGFFAKELAEDLKTCGMISSFSDEEEYCVVGRGALEALQLMFDQDSLPQRHALQLMIALLPHARSGWRGQRPLGLHDVHTLRNTFVHVLPHQDISTENEAPRGTEQRLVPGASAERTICTRMHDVGIYYAQVFA